MIISFEKRSLKPSEPHITGAFVVYEFPFRVCHKHFHEDDIIRNCVGVDPETGSEALFPVRVKLQEGAVPRLNLNNSNSFKVKKKGRRPGRPRKVPKVTYSSSDEDVPLETLKNQSADNTLDSPVSNTDGNLDLGLAYGKSLKQKFLGLLEEYEQLKNRHVSLGQEIDILEKVNLNLKCKLFKF